MDIKKLELQEDIGQLKEELLFLTSHIAAKLKCVAQLDEQITQYDKKRNRLTKQLKELEKLNEDK
jgi:hypothetical protein